jgi:predicted oxidoreductase
LLDTKPAPQEINRRLHACVDRGITTIDTAEIYGRYEVESALGAALAFKPDGQAGNLPSGSKPQIRGCFPEKIRLPSERRENVAARITFVVKCRRFHED